MIKTFSQANAVFSVSRQREACFFYKFYISYNLSTKLFLCNDIIIGLDPCKGELKMADDSVEKVKADSKKAVADIGKGVAYAKADVNANVDKIKANIEHDEAGEKVAYAKADLKADAAKGKADIENTMAHAKADGEKAKAGIEKKLSDTLK